LKNILEGLFVSFGHFFPSTRFPYPSHSFRFELTHSLWTIHQNQFPLHLGYTATFNSWQCVTLDKVVLDLQTSVFTHGELYCTISWGVLATGPGNLPAVRVWTAKTSQFSSRPRLHLWCYRYTSGIIQDRSIIQLWILNLTSWILIRISLLDQPSGFVHLLLSASEICIIFNSVLVIGSPLSMVSSHRQETLFLVAEQTTILLCQMVHSSWDEMSLMSYHYHISRYSESYRS